MSDPYLGEIRMFGGNYAPLGWAFCDGELLSISENDALFTLLGTTYGGDGVTTFGLPDLRSRSPIGWGTGPGLSTIGLGELAGTENVSLTLAQLPAHSHGAQAQISIPAVESSNNVQSAPAATTRLGPVAANGRAGTLYSTDPATTNLAPFSSPVTLSSTGGSQPLPVRDPGLGINFIIALQGIFPPRS